MRWLTPFLLLLWNCVSAATPQFDHTAGYQLAGNTDGDRLTRNRPYVVTEGTIDFDDDKRWLPESMEGAVRAWYDFEERRGRVDLREATATWRSDASSIRIGMQEVSWGETFGLYIADLMNPRDLSDPILNDLAWIRIPAFMVNAQFYKGAASLQLIYTPVPRMNRLPRKGDAFDITPSALASLPLYHSRGFSTRHFGRDAEYGARLGYLFDSGLDLSLFYTYHWNRDTVYALVATPGGLVLEPVDRRIHSFGAGFSKAFTEIVIRGDGVLHLHTPWPTNAFGVIGTTDLFRTILGVDRIWSSGWTLGGQFHLDVWDDESLVALSAQVMKTFDEAPWELRAFVYEGLNTRDRWIQPQVIWKGKENLEVALRGDFIWGRVKTGTPVDGILGPFRKKDRLFLWVTYRF